MGKDSKCDDYGKILGTKYAINEMKLKRQIIAMNKILFKPPYFVEILCVNVSHLKKIDESLI